MGLLVPPLTPPLNRAEQLASEIKELQGEMADYNTVSTFMSTLPTIILIGRSSPSPPTPVNGVSPIQLIDKLNTDTEMAAVLADCATVS